MTKIGLKLDNDERAQTLELPMNRNFEITGSREARVDVVAYRAITTDDDKEELVVDDDFCGEVELYRTDRNNFKVQILNGFGYFVVESRVPTNVTISVNADKDGKYTFRHDMQIVLLEFK